MIHQPHYNKSLISNARKLQREMIDISLDRWYLYFIKTYLEVGFRYRIFDRKENNELIHNERIKLILSDYYILGGFILMDLVKAIAIITALCDGIDPITGVILPKESLYNNSEVIRAMHASLTALERMREAIRKRGVLPINAGKPWNTEEEKIVINGYKNGMTIQELARQQERTIGGIRSRLEHIGILQEKDKL